jgi:phosphatidyl-myo-inositol dimannoside synthase
MQKKFKILHVTRNFPPLQGGMERLNQKLFCIMSRRYQMILCGPKGASAYVPPESIVKETELNPLWWFLTRTMCLSVFSALKNKPELIIAGSGLTAPIAYVSAKISGAQSAVYLHGLDVVVHNKFYQWCWLPLIRRCDHVLVNSKNTANLAVDKGVAKSKIDFLLPGTDIPILSSASAASFRLEHGLVNSKILLVVGRLTARKGIAEFVTNCLPEIAKAFPDVALIIIGAEATQALVGGNANGKNEIQRQANRAGVGDNIKFLGHCSDQQLSDAYQVADIHIFPVIELPGDIEGFGMVAIEAAAHGLHTIAFAVGGVSESVADNQSGDLILAGDYRQFTKKVLSRLSEGRKESDLAACLAFAEKNSWENFEKNINTLCTSWQVRS